MITAFEKVSGQALNYEVVARRPGDVISVYADTQKAKEVLGWEAERSLEQALDSAWRWEQHIRNI